MAVGWHAVRRGEVGKGDVAIVIGCGPIGLAVICMLKAHGVRTVDRQRLLARPPRARHRSAAPTSSSTPRRTRPTTAAEDHGHLETAPDALDLAVGTIEKLQQLRAALVARLARRRGARRRDAQASRRLRVRRRARHHRRHHHRRAAVLPRRRRRRLHGRRPAPAVDGDQQGDRPALRARLHAARVPRHAAHARRRQGRRHPAGHRDRRARTASTTPSTRSATPRRTPRS